MPAGPPNVSAHFAVSRRAARSTSWVLDGTGATTGMRATIDTLAARPARRLIFAAAALGAVAALFLSPATAHAQLEQRLTGRFGGAFEFKAGPYLPALARSVDDGGLPAFTRAYGEDRTRVLINFGAELQIYRSYWTTLSLAATVGYISWDRTTLEPQQGDMLTFKVVPMTLTAGARFDYLMQKTPVPLAPYVRFGFAYNLWWNDQPFEAGLDRNGGRPGWTGTLGLAVALNAIDKTAAYNLQDSIGVRTTYAFIEGQMSSVDGFGDGNLDLSDTTWFAGLRLEI